MPPTYTEHETVSLKNHADFNEGWLQNIIAENPAILGLGELGFIPKERRQESGGRLDLLLSDENDVRYEVELQLGATDEQHLIHSSLSVISANAEIHAFTLLLSQIDSRLRGNDMKEWFQLFYSLSAKRKVIDRTGRQALRLAAHSKC